MELNKLHNESVKAIFGMLYDILSLYESSGCYNYIPDTENSDDAPEYFGGLIENIRKKLNADFLRACLVSSENNADKSQRKHLKGIL